MKPHKNVRIAPIKPKSDSMRDARAKRKPPSLRDKRPLFRPTFCTTIDNLSIVTIRIPEIPGVDMTTVLYDALVEAQLEFFSSREFSDEMERRHLIDKCEEGRWSAFLKQFDAVTYSFSEFDPPEGLSLYGDGESIRVWRDHHHVVLIEDLRKFFYNDIEKGDDF